MLRPVGVITLGLAPAILFSACGDDDDATSNTPVVEIDDDELRRQGAATTTTTSASRLGGRAARISTEGAGVHRRRRRLGVLDRHQVRRRSGRDGQLQRLARGHQPPDQRRRRGAHPAGGSPERRGGDDEPTTATDRHGSDTGSTDADTESTDAPPSAPAGDCHRDAHDRRRATPPGCRSPTSTTSPSKRSTPPTPAPPATARSTPVWRSSSRASTLSPRPSFTRRIRWPSLRSSAVVVELEDARRRLPRSTTCAVRLPSRPSPLRSAALRKRA